MKRISMILFAAALLLPWCRGAATPDKRAVPDNLKNAHAN